MKGSPPALGFDICTSCDQNPIAGRLHFRQQGPVGYSNRESELSNLLRDDLGFTHDLSNLNYENAYTRGIMAGEYQANVHLFSEHGSPPPIPVWLIVSVKRENGVTLRLVETEATLTHHGQEITAVRFGLTDEGRLVAGSIHAVPRPLRGRR